MALHAVAPLQVRRWERALANVEREQRRILSNLVANSAKTAFGAAHGFSEIRGYESFARRVPIGDYDSFSPYIERMRRGEGNVLVPERVVYFGNSSGSSDAGRSKFLPITERQITETRRAGGDALMKYVAWSGDRELTRGFTLGLFHPMTMDRQGPVVITTNPVLMMEKTPLFTRPLTLPHRRTNLIEDYDEKMTALAERYLDWDVRALTGTTCWFPVLLERVLEVAKRRGRSADTVGAVWPNLRVLFGGGVSAEPYMPFIRQLVGHDVTLVDTYNATEGGIYAASDHSGAPGMPIIPHRGTFFELLPLDAPDEAAGRIPIWAAERDRLYAIVVTTSAGLFAYKLGDIVRFPSVDPLRIEFVGRLSGCLSITQELATHVDVERAVAHATKACPSTTVDFGAAAEIGIAGTSKSRYLLFVEFEPGRAPSDLAAFGAAFDEGMRNANRVYGEHRGVALAAPRIVTLRPGGARSFLEDITRGNFQGKFPRILDQARAERAFAYAEES